MARIITTRPESPATAAPYSLHKREDDRCDCENSCCKEPDDGECPGKDQVVHEIPCDVRLYEGIMTEQPAADRDTCRSGQAGTTLFEVTRKEFIVKAADILPGCRHFRESCIVPCGTDVGRQVEIGTGSLRRTSPSVHNTTTGIPARSGRESG